MRRWLILILLLMSFTLVTATDICEDQIRQGEECQIITPPILCSTYDIYYQNGTILRNDSNLTKYGDSENLYYFIFNETEGEYVIELCDGATSRQLTVLDNYMIFFTIAFIFVFITSLVVFALYKARKIHWKVILSIALTLMLTILLRFAAWFVEINYSSETVLINTLNTFYSWGVRALYFIVAGAMLFLVVYILNSIKEGPRKRRKSDWENWGKDE